MGRRPEPLPLALEGHGFTLAEAREAGLAGRFRRYPGPSNGIRVVGADPDDEGEAFLRHVGLVLRAIPDAVLSHGTAARLWGLPHPRVWAPAEPIDVLRAHETPYLSRRGLRSHRGLDLRTTATREDLLVTSLLDTWSDLVTCWPRPRVLAAGDVLLRDHEVMPDEIASHLDGLHGRRGVRTLRELAPLLRSGAASPKESEARLLFHDEGLPEPELNVDVYDDWGSWLARPDFVWRQQRVLGEYDGDQHRTDRGSWQYERDRRARLEDSGWRYVEMTNADLGDHARRLRLVARLRRHLT